MFLSVYCTYADDLPLLLKCYELQSQVLYKDNLTLALTNDTLAQVYALQGTHKKSQYRNDYKMFLDLLCFALPNSSCLHFHIVAGDHTKSAHYCAASCRALGVAYGENAVEVGNELFKLAPLYFYRYKLSI